MNINGWCVTLSILGGKYMNTTKYIRLASMTIDNIKNIEHGRINFINTRKDYKSSLLGIYGQNGSGKNGTYRCD